MENNSQNHIVGISEILISYGRHTPWINLSSIRSYEDAMSQKITAGNHWSSTENGTNNAWYVSFSSGFTSYTGKYHSFVVRPSVACELSNL